MGEYLLSEASELAIRSILRVGLGEHVSQTARFELILSGPEETTTQILQAWEHTWERYGSLNEIYATDLPAWFSKFITDNLGIEINHPVSVTYSPREGICTAVGSYHDPKKPGEVTTVSLGPDILGELGRLGVSLGLRRIIPRRPQLPEYLDLIKLTTS